MTISHGEHLVNVEIRELKRKLAGVGGKYLNPHEKAVEISKVIENLKRLHQQQKKDRFFVSKDFKNIAWGLEHILVQTQNTLQRR